MLIILQSQDNEIIHLLLLILVLFIRDEHGVYVCVTDQYMTLYFNPTDL